jgi:hypothetical protein
MDEDGNVRSRMLVAATEELPAAVFIVADVKNWKALVPDLSASEAPYIAIHLSFA